MTCLIRYTDSAQDITPDQLEGFFVGWPNPPSPETHLRVLHGSDYVWLAMDQTSGKVVGFITAISDGVLAAYIPLLEVLPAYQGQGIGTELTRRMLDTLSHLYAIDLVCEPSVQPIYARFGMKPVFGMAIRNHARQSGE